MKRFDVENPSEKTLGEFIQNRYPDFKIDTVYGKAPLDTDISHGIEVEEHIGSGYGDDVILYPYCLWTDGSYGACHYWGQSHYLRIERG